MDKNLVREYRNQPQCCLLVSVKEVEVDRIQAALCRCIACKEQGVDVFNIFPPRIDDQRPDNYPGDDVDVMEDDEVRS